MRYWFLIFLLLSSCGSKQNSSLKNNTQITVISDGTDSSSNSQTTKTHHSKDGVFSGSSKSLQNSDSPQHLEEAPNTKNNYSNLKSSSHRGELISVEQLDINYDLKSSVVLVVIDALNKEHLGAYGYKRDTSTNIDTIAREGVLFSNWKSNSSWTRPSFTTIVSGVPKSVHKMELGENKLSKKIVTLAEHFQNAGYKTGAFIGNPLIQKEWNYDQGFDIFVDSKSHGGFPRGDLLVDQAVDWIEQQDDLYFAVLFLTDPHTPYNAPENELTFRSRITNDTSVVAPPKETINNYSANKLKELTDNYDDEIKYVDNQLQPLFNILDHATTTIAITADHGEILGEHNCFQHAYHMWRQVIDVPFIIKSPAIKNSGAILNAPATHIDIAPSLLKIAGIKTDKKFHGLDIFSKIDDSRVIISAYQAGGIRRYVAVQNNFKLIRFEKINLKKYNAISNTPINLLPSLQTPAPRYELYDTNKDLNEDTNLYDSLKNNQKVKSLVKEIKKFKNRQHSNSNQNKLNQLDHETLDALKAAGYIQ